MFHNADILVLEVKISDILGQSHIYMECPSETSQAINYAKF